MEESSRRMRTILALPILVLAASLTAGAVAADDHLVPEDNQFTRAALPNGQGSLAPYYGKVLELLGGAYAREVRARVIVMPSYGTEHAIGIAQNGDAYEMFHLSLAANIWRYEMLQQAKAVDVTRLPAGPAQDMQRIIAEMQRGIPDDYHDITVTDCRAPLPPALARQVIESWEKLLLRTRYTPARQVGRDGTDYHFSMPNETQQLAGKAWDPPPDSDIGRLVAITANMKAWCAARDETVLAQMQTQARNLVARLQN